MGSTHDSLSCATARSCQAFLSYIVQENPTHKIRRRVGGSRFAASGSFCLCVLFMTIVITFRAELKNMQKFCKRLGGMIREQLHGLFGADNLDSA